MGEMKIEVCALCGAAGSELNRPCPGHRTSAANHVILSRAGEGEETAKKLYTKHTDNHPTIHSNRFPSWDELDETDKAEWRSKAAAPPSPALEAEPVAYRWRPKGGKSWFYGPTLEWIEAHKDGIEYEPLYAHPPASQPAQAAELTAEIEIIYGLLWCVDIDKATVSGVAASMARKLALELIDKDGQRRGIDVAQRAVRGKILSAIPHEPMINPRAG